MRHEGCCQSLEIETRSRQHFHNNAQEMALFGYVISSCVFNTRIFMAGVPKMPLKLSGHYSEEPDVKTII
ncbi:hypothetical protein QVD17_06781 [Tagetes erecta]|uniref:Uncharacterized protein n=1 Tax=Tagetes erecta TaxID=13708 RepID=A0AAD8LKV9_TARER|nr:hypothetical protein QVD17_06781 [Tagetes erecta]